MNEIAELNNATVKRLFGKIATAGRDGKQKSPTNLIELLIFLSQ